MNTPTIEKARILFFFLTSFANRGKHMTRKKLQIDRLATHREMVERERDVQGLPGTDLGKSGGV